MEKRAIGWLSNLKKGLKYASKKNLPISNIDYIFFYFKNDKRIIYLYNMDIMF